MKYLSMHEMNMPVLGFGTWKLSGDGAVEAIKKALSIGYRHIDTAQMYGNEAEVGQAIAAARVPRKDIFLTTKVWMESAAPAQVKSSVAESLAKLKLDYVDLLLLHWPNKNVPLVETLGALDELRKQGKTRAIGVSNFPVSLMREAIKTFKFPVACNQVEYHVMLSQEPVLAYARAHDVAVTAYSPLGQGQLTQHPGLTEIAAKYGKTGAQVALRWLIEQPNVAAIPKAGSEKNMRLNFEIFDFELSAEDRAAIAKLGGQKRFINPSWAPAWDNAA
jgi:2,5-diketo-D-gluconate reductase B